MSHEDRRRRFKAWFRQTYGEDSKEARAQFMRATTSANDPPLTKGRVTQLLDESEPFGEVTARRLALRLGIDEATFLKDSPADQLGRDQKAEGQLIADMTDLRRINPETYRELMRKIHEIASGARASDAVIGHRSKKGYVTPERIQTTLGKLSPPPAPPDPEPSGFGELAPQVIAPQTKRGKRT